MAKKRFPLKIECDYEIRREEMFRLVVQFLREYPEVGVQIIAVLEKGEKKRWQRISCPFPFVCNEFPCETLSCNADTCSNGHAYRMS